MKIHEYQAKDLFLAYGIPTITGNVCHDKESCLQAYTGINSPKAVVKAQVHTGGRGKAGGVKLVHNQEELVSNALKILGLEINGFKTEKVLVAEAVDIASEYYLSLVVDRNSKSVIMILSREGGIDIEDVAKKTPEKIHKIPIDPLVGITDFKAREAGFYLFDEFEIVKQFVPMIKNLYTLMVEKDASLVEINPLVVTKQGRLLAIDAKMTFDDNALYRQSEIEGLAELTNEEIVEKEAKNKGFSFVALNGKIGCMVNGAGLAMSTMDTIKLYGGEPANFLDIGGSSNPGKVIEAMKLLLSDPNVNVVLINIFGGITRCDDVAKGLIEAFKSISTDIPIVVRLSGTNEKEGNEMLKGSPFFSASTMGEAIKKAVELSHKNS